jgi:protein TonB
MSFRSLIVGLTAAATLICVLALSRLMVAQVVPPDLMIREIEILEPEIPPPPPPPPDAPPPDPPPPPAIANLSDTPDPSRVPLPRADVPLDITLAVDTFFTDLPPAALPEAPRSPAPRPAEPRATPPSPRPAPPPPPARSVFDVGELDGTPRLLRHGSAPFPPALARRGVASGTVVLEVELSPRGAVSVRRVVSASHDELIPAARRIAGGARYTPPTRNGQAVSAVMRWPITIQR